jgi:hypothetical protein
MFLVRSPVFERTGLPSEAVCTANTSTFLGPRIGIQVSCSGVYQVPYPAVFRKEGSAKVDRKREFREDYPSPQAGAFRI